MKKGLRKTKYHINHDFFKKWSNDMAYILGLWWADGYICKGRSYVFGITLDRKDKYLLQDVLDTMRSNHLLYKNKNTYSIGICSKTIVTDIIDLGGISRKSLFVEFPDVPKDLMIDFIRGYFDGDGSVYKLKTRCGYESNFASSSKKFIVSLKKVLEENIVDLKCRLYTNESTINPSYRIDLSSNNTRRLRDYIYNSNSKLKMKRKYDKHMLNGLVKLSVSDKKFYPYNEAIIVARGLGLCTNRQWHKYFKNNKNELTGIPSHPEIIYKKEWAGWSKWLGKE